jgi:oxidase EvaA
MRHAATTPTGHAAEMLTAVPRADFLSSGLAVEGVATPSEEARAWLAQRREECRGNVERVPISELDGWRFDDDPLRLVHGSGRFFAVEGYTVCLDGIFRSEAYDQPLINQPETGALGFLAKRFGGVLHLLTQAKMEPGNVERVQLAPTVQATESNYTRAHGGRLPPYLEYFLEPRRGRVLVDEEQPEQAAYFLGKRNRNIVVETADDVSVGDDFRWLTIGQLKELLRTDYAVNMDARSVLSCLPLADVAKSRGEDPAGAEAALDPFSRRLLASARPGAPAERLLGDVYAWLEALRAHAGITLVPRSLDALAGWCLDRWQLAPAHRGGGFSVVGVAVEAPSREVPAWSQPLLEREGIGLLGLLCQQRRGSLHFLLRASVEPGCRATLQLSPTVTCHDDASQIDRITSEPFGDWFSGGAAARVRFTALHSEEGGRVDRFVYRYVIAELPSEADLELPPDYAWLTLDQLARLRPRGYLSTEARNLVACLGLRAEAAP